MCQHVSGGVLLTACDPMLTLLILLLGLMVYAQVGYNVVMWVLARFRPSPLQASDPMPEGISIVLCVHNGEGRIQERLQNLAHCEWEGLREILVFCDGCTDATASRALDAGVPGVRVLSSNQQRGKWAALNEAVAACTQPVVVFADLRQTFDRQALKHLASAFQDPRVGAVSGLLEIASSTSGGGQGVDLYWKLERKLREWEARFDSVIGCTGAIYAIRRSTFREIQASTILDDVVVPMQIAVQGWRVAYDPKAIAYDPQTLEPEKEKQRKLRTLVGNYQMLERHPEWLLPGRNRVWWQLLSHKYARLAVPWLMLSIALITVALSKTPLVWPLFAGQVVCYGLGLIGLLVPGCRLRAVTIPSGFLLLQWTCARALFAYLSCRKDPLKLWQPATPVSKP